MEHATSRIVRPVIPAAVETHRRRSARAASGLAVGALATLVASPAFAVLREYRMQFQPSPTAGVAGYTMHIGTATRSYQAQFDLGSPPVSGGTVVYALDLETSMDLYVALRAYTATGAVSAYSSEIHLAPVTTGGTGGGTGGTGGDTGGTGGGTGGTGGDTGGTGGGTGGTGGGTGGGTMNPPGTLDPDVALGLATKGTALIARLMPNGSAGALTMDSLAVYRSIRPVACDLEGDGDRDLVIGFGHGSGGTISVLRLENGAVAEARSVQAGTARYRKDYGRTVPACGDIDGDGRAELVVGFSGAMRGVVQVFDDITTGFAPLATARSNAEGYMQIPVPAKFKGFILPALGDIDGDGRDELVAGLTDIRWGLIAVLDDSVSGFAPHPVNRSGNPWYRVEPSSSSSLSGGMTAPALGDIDGDGLDEVVVGFGAGSRGRVVILDDAEAGWPDSLPAQRILTAGRATYQSRDGAVRPALGDVDGDGVDEIVVGFMRDGDHELQAFDDLGAQLQPMGANGGFVSSADASMTVYPVPAQ